MRTRKTYYFENNYIDKIDKIAKRKGCTKTFILNEFIKFAIEFYKFAEKHKIELDKLEKVIKKTYNATL